MTKKSDKRLACSKKKVKRLVLIVTVHKLWQTRNVLLYYSVQLNEVGVIGVLWKMLHYSSCMEKCFNN